MKKGTLIAVGVFAALLLTYLATAEREVSVGVKHLTVSALSSDSITSIELSGSQKLALKKEGDHWAVELANPAGKRVPADDSLVKSALEAAGKGITGEYVSSRPEKLKDAEVTDEKGLTAKFSQGTGSPVEVTFGRAANTGGTFIRQGNSEDVFVTNSQLPYLLKREANAWRKRGFLSLTPAEVKSVTFKSPSASLTVNAAADSKWELDPTTQLPAGFRVDPSAVSRVPGEVSTLSAADFVDGAASDADLGLAGPHASVAITTKDGKTTTVHIGAAGDQKWVTAASSLKAKFKALDDAGDKDGSLNLAEFTTASATDASVAEALKLPQGFAFAAHGGWAATSADQLVSLDDLNALERTGALTPVRVEGDTQVYLLQPYAVKNLTKTINDFRNLSLLDFDTAKVTKLSITYEGKKTIATKGKDGWKITEPAKLPAGFDFEPSQVEAQLNQLKSIHGTAVAEGVTDAAAGLAKPTVTIELTTDAKKPVTLMFGAKAEANEFYARGNIDSFTYRVQQFTRDNFGRGVELFKRPPAPPNMGNMNNIQGLDQLPPEIRAQLMQQMRQQQMQPPH